MCECGCMGAPIPAPRRQSPDPTLCSYSPERVEVVSLLKKAALS
jgi:hypothetical protein